MLNSVVLSWDDWPKIGGESRVPTKRQIAGMRGVYAVAAELSRLEFEVEVLPMGSGLTNLFATELETRKRYSLKVHTDQQQGRFWVVPSVQVTDPDRFYVFVWFRDAEQETFFYVVPSGLVACLRRNISNNWWGVDRKDVEKYEGAWTQFFGPRNLPEKK